MSEKMYLDDILFQNLFKVDADVILEQDSFERTDAQSLQIARG